MLLAPTGDGDPATDKLGCPDAHLQAISDRVVVPLHQAARRGPVRLRIWGGQPEDGAAELPDVTGMTNAEAAEAYAKAGICVVSIRPGTKNPGSYLGKGWPQLATCDLDTVRGWWRRWPTAGIATHIGASRLLVIDVDHPEHVPEWLWRLLELAVFRPTTSNPDSRRGHYFYRLRPGDRFGCGLGKLKPSQGNRWGEVKCYGGAVVLGPTQHPRAAEGGEYGTGPAGSIPLVPVEIADKLNAASDPGEHRSLTPGELDDNAKRFLAKYTDDREPHALDPICGSFDPRPSSRHPSMWDALCWAMREGKAGRFPVQRAVDELQHQWQTAIGGEYRNDDPDEFNRLLRDAIAVADADGTVEELWDRANRDGGGDREARIAKRVRELDERDEAQRRHDEQKAQQLVDVNADRAKSGLVFLTANADAEPLWGQGTQVLWAPGEGLMIVGPQGVGKSTVAQQLVLARMGINSPMLFDMPVVRDERPILYLAMDRPAQIRRSMLRMLDLTNEDVAAAIGQRLIVWEGPLPFDAARMARRAGGKGKPGKAQAAHRRRVRPPVAVLRAARPWRPCRRQHYPGALRAVLSRPCAAAEPPGQPRAAHTRHGQARLGPAAAGAALRLAARRTNRQPRRTC